MTKEINMTFDKDTLYLIDNGAVACGNHLGNHVAMTGICRDGEPVITLESCTKGDPEFAAVMADADCESCRCDAAAK